MKQPLYLKILRMTKFKNQFDAADALGISRPWYNMIENGRLDPTDEIKYKLESVFGTPSDVLLSTANIEKLAAKEV